MPPNVSNLQSLFQLSAALNLGFVGYISLSGNELKREESLISDLYLIVQMNKANDAIIGNKKLTEEIAEIEKDLIDLKGVLRNRIVEINKLPHGLMKFFIIASSLGSICMLYYSTFYQEDLRSWHFWLSVLFMAPLFLLLAIMYGKSIAGKSEISIKRKEIDGKIERFLLRIPRR